MARRPGWWELKCNALLPCAFAELLLPVADNGSVGHPSGVDASGQNFLTTRLAPVG
jgi:hypothetical protein